MKQFTAPIKMSQWAALAIAAASLSACYVIPARYDADTNQYVPATTAPQAPAMTVQAAVPTSQVLIARLYPSNAIAAPFGIMPGTVTNHLNGRGEIVVTVGDEIYRGEATRTGNTTSGTANGAGSKGGYMSCAYTMNNATQGRGNCNFGNGATFTFHLGS